jgi:uncharacterized protein (TIGR03083 family)
MVKMSDPSSVPDVILPLPVGTYAEAIRSGTESLLFTLNMDPDGPVPTCPGWNVTRLVGHLSRVHQMATVIVSRALMQRPEATDTDTPPVMPVALETYVRTNLEKLEATLGATPLNNPAWNMVGPPPQAAFWHRRMAHETIIHRVDAELAVGLTPVPIAPELAIDGVNEFLDMFRARVLPQHPEASLGGTLHLHATDGDGHTGGDGDSGEWMISLENGTLDVTHGHGKGAAAVRGTASELMLGVWGRRALDTAPFELFGDAEVVRRWMALGGF